MIAARQSTVATDDGVMSLGRVLGRIARTRLPCQKDKLFLSVSREDRPSLVGHAILLLPSGIYSLDMEGRAAPPVRGMIEQKYGVFAGLEVTKNMLCGLSVLYPKKIRATFTLGLQEIEIR